MSHTPCSRVKSISLTLATLLLQAHSKADTVSYKPETEVAGDNAALFLSQKTCLDRHQLALSIEKCDQELHALSAYIAERIARTEEAGLQIPRILRLSRKYGFSKHEEDIFLLMTVMQVKKTTFLSQYGTFCLIMPRNPTLTGLQEQPSPELAGGGGLLPQGW